MKKIFKTLTAFGVLFCCLILASPAKAVPQGMWGDQPNLITQGSGSAFTTVDISSGVTTDAIDAYGYRFITFELDYVYSAATSVTMTCQESDASAGTYRTIQGLQASGSTLTSNTLTWSKAVTATTSWSWTVSLLGYAWLKCTFTAVGGGAGDTLTVDSVLAE